MANLKVVNGSAWGELKETEARALFETGSVELYKLYDDGSDALIEDDADLEITLTRKIPIGIELQGMNVPSTYGVFIMIELARLHELIKYGLKLDLTYEKGIELYDAFLKTEYANSDEPEYDAIEAFLTNSKSSGVFQLAVRLLDGAKGFTYSEKRQMFMGKDNFFVIGTSGHEKTYSELPTVAEVEEFHRQNKELLLSGDLCLGGWLDSVNDKYVLDVSMLVPTSIGIDEAVLIGKRHGQVAVFDLRDSSVIFVDEYLNKNSVSSEL